MPGTKPEVDTFIGNGYPPADSAMAPPFKSVDGSIGSVSKNAGLTTAGMKSNAKQ